jgi:flagellar FliL protein
MSSTIVEQAADDTAPKKKKFALPAFLKLPRLSKKQWIIFGLAFVLVLAAAGGATAVILKQRADAAAAEAAEADDGEDEAGDEAAAEDDEADDRPTARDRGTPPIFVPLEAFTVNLADKDAERFAQIGVTLEITDPKFAEELKTYMPAIRNGMLMLLSHKTSGELLDRAGKEKLAREVGRETLRAMDLDPADPGGKSAGGDESAIRRVHFASFIIQ